MKLVLVVAQLAGSVATYSYTLADKIMNSQARPVTITIVHGNSLASFLMGVISQSLAPVVHGCQPHFYKFQTWTYLCNNHSKWFHVGMVAVADEALDSLYKNFISSPNAILFDFILLDECGKTLIWKLDDRIEIIRTSLMPFEGGVIARITDQLRGFLQEKYGSGIELVSPLYIQDKHEEKLRIVIPDFQIINNELVEFLLKNPHILHHLHHRKFEELLAAVFRNLGYEVELGPGSGDGGVDLRLIDRSDVGPILILVQAKKYAPHRRITLEPVQALFGAVENEYASLGILVSTSEFQPAAKRFAKAKPHRIQLAGPGEIQAWLRKALIDKTN